MRRAFVCLCCLLATLLIASGKFVGGRAVEHRPQGGMESGPAVLMPPGGQAALPLVSPQERRAAFPSSSLAGQQADGAAIRIGLLVPRSGSRRWEAREVQRAAEMAVAEANSARRGPRFQLLVRTDDRPWGAGSREAVRLAFEDGVCALIGAVDSASAHVIEQVAMKARLVFITPWASDSTLTQIGIPWIFRCVPDDHQQAEALTREIFGAKRLRRVGLVIADDRSARLSADAFARAAAQSGHPIPSSLRWQWKGAGDGQPVGERAVVPSGRSPASRDEILSQIEGEPLEAVALFAPAASAADFMGAVKQRRMSAAVFTPLPSTSAADAFRRRFRARYGTSPTPPAAYAYDATYVVLRAVLRLAPAPGRRPDSAALRDAIARTRFEGVTGTVQFDRKGNRLSITRRTHGARASRPGPQ